MTIPRTTDQITAEEVIQNLLHRFDQKKVLDLRQFNLDGLLNRLISLMTPEEAEWLVDDVNRAHDLEEELEKALRPQPAWTLGRTVIPRVAAFIKKNAFADMGREPTPLRDLPLFLFRLWLPAPLVTWLAMNPEIEMELRHHLAN